MHRLKPFKEQLLFTLFLCAAILVMPFQDYTERALTAEMFHYSNSYSDCVTNADGTLTIQEHPEGILFYSDDFYFKQGTYTLTFRGTAQGAGNRIEVFDPLTVNADNTSGKVLARTDIPAGNEEAALSFSIEDYTGCVQFRLITKSAMDFQGVYLLSETGLYKDPYIYAGLLLAASALLLVYRTRKKVRTEVLILLAFAAIWSTLPLSYNWLYDGHDLSFHYGRLFNLSDSLANGQFPVRIHSRMYRGFGYLSPVFYPECFLYPFAVLGILGLSPIGCYKLLILSINFATAGVAYYSFSRLLRSRRIGLIAAFLYTLSMYRFVNLYTRAAVGEALAMIFLPLLVLGMYQLFIGNSKKWYTAALAFTCLLQSHMITTELSVAFGVLFALCFLRNLKDKGRLLHICLAALFTVLMNVWYLVPMLDHMQYSLYVFSDMRKLSSYALYAIQLFDVGILGAALDAKGPASTSLEMPYSVGVVLLIGCLLFLMICFRKKNANEHIKMGKYCLVLGVLSLYASTNYFPWEALQRIEPLNRLISSIQFSSRFLPFATVFLCLVSAIGIYHFFVSREQKQMLFITCAILAVYSSGSYFSNYTSQAESFVSWNAQTERTQETDLLYLIDNGGERFSVAEMEQQDTNFEYSDGIVLTDCYREGTEAGFTYTKTEDTTDAYVDVSFNYYPYYRAYDSAGNQLETTLNELLNVRVFLPDAQTDTITVHFEVPALYRVCDAVSLTAMVLFIGLALVQSRAATRKKNQSLTEENV